MNERKKERKRRWLKWVGRMGMGMGMGLGMDGMGWMGWMGWMKAWQGRILRKDKGDESY